MPLHINRVETELEALPSDDNGAGRMNRGGVGAATSLSERELREVLRPIVLDILREELDRLRRQKG